MEKTKHFLQLPNSESELISQLTFSQPGLYESFSLRGIIVDRVEPGLVSCTFKVPPRLTDRTGNLASGAIANLVDEVGSAVVQIEGLPMNVSVDMSISLLGFAKLGDELEIESRVLGQRGSYYGTIVLVRNKVTGELIAEGRHSLFGRHNSKI
ncbi:hypothetical protein LguiA_002729 [Lonicera macranthoides]